MKRIFLGLLLVLTAVITSSTHGQTNFESYLVLRGAFVIVGKQPDGDSIRFRPDDLNLLQKLKRANRIEPSKDGTVQLRLEGIDAPELHHENVAQPFNKEPRDALLTWFGFTDVTFTPKGLQVKTSNPKSVRGAILTQAAEVYGRPVSYALLERDAKQLEDGSRMTVSATLLSRTINAHMLETGMAYYTVYSSRPRAPHRIPSHNRNRQTREARRVGHRQHERIHVEHARGCDRQATDLAETVPPGGGVLPGPRERF